MLYQQKTRCFKNLVLGSNLVLSAVVCCLLFIHSYLKLGCWVASAWLDIGKKQRGKAHRKTVATAPARGQGPGGRRGRGRRTSFCALQYEIMRVLYTIEKSGVTSAARAAFTRPQAPASLDSRPCACDSAGAAVAEAGIDAGRHEGRCEGHRTGIGLGLGGLALLGHRRPCR